MPETDSVLFYKLNKQIEPQGTVDLQNLQKLTIYYEKKWLFKYSFCVRWLCFLDMCIKLNHMGIFLANMGILERNLKDLVTLLFSVVQIVTMIYYHLLFSLSLKPLKDFFSPKLCQSLFHRNTKTGGRVN